MANRDLFSGVDTNRRRAEDARGSIGRRLFWQGLAALLLFAGVVCLYEQESQLGEGVRYVVALAQADEQESMAVNGLADLWRETVAAAKLPQQDNTDEPDADEPGSDEADANEADILDGDYQPGEDYLAAATLNDEGAPVLILPASGLMQGAFGEVTEQGLPLLGLQIFCQGEQEVKAAAIGEVTEVTPGERVTVSHTGGVETCYTGAITAEVKVGDVLRQGEAIGRITDAMLFFQVLVDGQPQDPFLFVKGPE